MAVPDESSTWPYIPPWTDDEQREHERFLDLTSAMVSECATQIDLATDEAKKAELMKWLIRLEDGRKQISVHDHAASSGLWPSTASNCGRGGTPVAADLSRYEISPHVVSLMQLEIKSSWSDRMFRSPSVGTDCGRGKPSGSGGPDPIHSGRSSGWA